MSPVSGCQLTKLNWAAVKLVYWVSSPCSFWALSPLIIIFCALWTSCHHSSSHWQSLQMLLYSHWSRLTSHKPRERLVPKECQTLAFFWKLWCAAELLRKPTLEVAHETWYAAAVIKELLLHGKLSWHGSHHLSPITLKQTRLHFFLQTNWWLQKSVASQLWF